MNLETLSICIPIGISLVALVAAGLTYWQNKRTADATKDSAEQAKRSADATKDSAEQAKRSADAAEESAAQAKRSVELAEAAEHRQLEPIFSFARGENVESTNLRKVRFTLTNGKVVDLDFLKIVRVMPDHILLLPASDPGGVAFQTPQLELGALEAGRSCAFILVFQAGYDGSFPRVRVSSGVANKEPWDRVYDLTLPDPPSYAYVL